MGLKEEEDGGGEGRKCFPPRLIVWRGANEKIYLVENENVALIAEIISISYFLFSFFLAPMVDPIIFFRRISHM